MTTERRSPVANFSSLASESTPASAQRRLPQLLAWQRYHSPRDHELELDRLFRPAWLCVGIKDSIPNEGDYFAFEHLGKPIFVQNQGDRVAAFHNVCPHRNALLARQRNGNMPRIKCGYHGWEYDRDGVVCRIPGGEYFKPMKRKEFIIDRVRVEVLGRLIFVSLDGNAPPLQDFLGAEVWERLSYALSSNVNPVASWTVEYECNWKVLIENTLEDYHVTSIHFATAGETPAFSQIAHTLDEKFVGFENRAPGFDTRAVHWMAARTRPDPQFTYFQYVSYPSLIFAMSPLSSHLHLVMPTSPTTCRADIILFLSRASAGPMHWLVHCMMRRPAIRLSKKFVEEDRTICNDVQKGIAAARFPGTLGCREERVHVFQQYVVDRCGDSAMEAGETSS
jgi:choline monooxygenase